MNLEKNAQWKKERDEAILSMDVGKFRKFYKKWQDAGLYKQPLPDNDMIIAISLRQAILAMENVSEGKMIEAQLWLIDHGCNPYPWK